MKIAVVGGGVSGLTAARQLSKKYDVTLFESEKCLGGHAYSGCFETKSGEKKYFDLGFELFSEYQAPNLYSMLKEIGVGTFVSPLSFAVAFDNGEDYWDNLGTDTALWRELTDEFERFHQGMSAIYNSSLEQVSNKTIGQYLIENNHSEAFIVKALLPIFTTFVGTHSSLLDYSLSYCAISFALNYLSFFQPTYWRKIKGGVSPYIEKLAQPLSGKIQLNTSIKHIERHADKVIITDNHGNQSSYDQVVLALHADIALSLLDSPSAKEAELLGSFQYTKITSVFHTDNSVFPIQCPKTIYCAYNGVNRPANNHKINGAMSRRFNTLYPYQSLEKELFVTIDPASKIEQSLVLASREWKLPKMRPQDMIVKKRLHEIQGKNRVWFCGLDTSLTGHEGALVSGLVVAEALGIEYPFNNSRQATEMYKNIKNIMQI